MTINYVTVICDLYNGDGSTDTAGGFAYFAPSTILANTTDHQLVTRAPISAQFSGPSLPSVSLLATDGANFSPSGWTWSVSFSQNPPVAGAPAPFSFYLPAGPTTFTATHASPAVFTWVPTTEMTALPNGTTIQLSGGSLPGGFSGATTYYVVSSSGTTFSLANTLSGTPINSSSTGSGSLTVTGVRLSGLTQLSSAPVTYQALPVLSANNVVTTGGVLAVNVVTDVDATAGTVAMTLPSSAPSGTLVTVEKYDTTLNAVTITGNVRGQPATVTSLQYQYQSIMYLFSAGTWWPVGDHKPISALDKRYSVVVKPSSYGAAGDGVTDDTTAIKSAFAAASALNGTLDLETYTFLTSSPIPIASNIRVKGSGSGNAFTGGAIKNSTTDLFTVAGTVTSVVFENCYLWSNTGGGHIFNGTTGNVSTGPICAFWTFKGVGINQVNAGKGIWYQIGGNFIDCTIEQNCQFVAAASASFVPWQILTAPGGVNGVKFSRSRMTFNGGTATVPFFKFDPGYGAHTDTNIGMTGGSHTVTDVNAIAGDLGMYIYHSNFSGGSSLITAVTPGTGYTVQTVATSNLSGQTAVIGVNGWYEEINFEHLTFEVCYGGCIAMTGSTDVEIKDCANWDITASNSNVYSFTQSLTGYPCSNIRVRGGRGGAVTGGVYNVYADSNCYSILLDSFGQGWGTAAVVSSPANQTTVLSPMVGATTVPPVFQNPGLQTTGINTSQTWATGRYVGVTASGAPSSGTYLTGDWITTQDGNVFGCTSGGTPGTWRTVGAAPQVTWITATGNTSYTVPAGAVSIDVAILAGGGGGGSGAFAAATGSNIGGGGAGSGGGYSHATFRASDLSSPVTVTVGAGGSGGAAVNSAGSGNPGVGGNASKFGTYAWCTGGLGGGAGTSSAGGAGGALVGGGTMAGGSGSNGGLGNAAGGTGTNVLATLLNGGAGGGGVNSAAQNGGTCQICIMGSSVNFGSGGTASGPVAATAGTQPSAAGVPSCGGGGGYSAISGAAGQGADAFYGGGGGGGGACASGTTSGRGGNGGNGFALIIAYF